MGLIGDVVHNQRIEEPSELWIVCMIPYVFNFVHAGLKSVRHYDQFAGLFIYLLTCSCYFPILTQVMMNVTFWMRGMSSCRNKCKCGTVLRSSVLSVEVLESSQM